MFLYVVKLSSRSIFPSNFLSGALKSEQVLAPLWVIRLYLEDTKLKGMSR